MMKIAVIETGKLQIPNPKSQSPKTISQSPKAKGQEVGTPFGLVGYEVGEVYGSELIFIDRLPIQNPKSKIQNPVDARGVAAAARVLGVERVIGVVRDVGVERPVVPGDFIEFTSGRPTTFFETMGAGYVQQEPPFCAELREALVAAGAEAGGRLLVVDELPGTAVREWWAGRGVTLISRESQPEGALCRELELCYAVLAVPAEFELWPLLAGVVAALKEERGCGCGQLTGGKWRQQRIWKENE